MEGFSVQELNVLVFCPLVPGDDNKPGGQVGVVVHLLARGGPTSVDQEHTLECHGGKRCHVEDIIVGQKEEIMGVV